jgi:type IX secretion system PorP/SprF family membrane protein
MKRIIILLLCCFRAPVFFAQDPHWSQAANNLLYFNPAFAGATGKFSAGAIYREQWNPLGAPYKTMGIAGDMRLAGKDGQSMKFNLGGVFCNDNNAQGNLKTNGFGLLLSSYVKGKSHMNFGAGLGINMVQATLFTDNMSWGTQYNGRSYDPALGSGESQRVGNASYMDISAGVSMVYDEASDLIDHNNNAKWITGYSASHLNSPDKGMFGKPDVSGIRHCLYVSGFQPAGDNVSLKPALVVMYQSGAYEATIGALYRYTLGQVSRITGIKKGSGIAFGAYYRYADAVIPAFEYEHENILFGVSYDINLSKLTPASNLRGGIEITIRIRNSNDYLYKDKKLPPTTRRMVP